MFLINFNQWKCACVGINNWVNSNIKFHKNPSIGNRVVPAGVRTDGHDDVTFRNFANAPVNNHHIWWSCCFVTGFGTDVFLQTYPVCLKNQLLGTCICRFLNLLRSFKMNLKYELTVDENGVSVTFLDYDLAFCLLGCLIILVGQVTSFGDWTETFPACLVRYCEGLYTG